MNLRDLQYLVAVADNMHFGKAALACNVSQPTLSMQLRKLEEFLHVQLMERSNKHVHFTPIGKKVVEQARRTLWEAEQIKELAKVAKDPFAGDIRMGIFPTLAPYLLPSVMPKIKEHLPHINLLLVEDKTSELVRLLELGELDCALMATPVKQEQFASIELFVEPFLLAVSVNHPLAERKTVTFSDMEKQELLLLDEGHCLREQALEVCHAIGIGEAQNFRATSLETLRHMVAAGNAVTLMPKLAVQKKDSLIRYIPFHKPVPSRSIALYWRKTSARELLFKRLSDVLKLKSI